jgi:hypothetical protein
MRPKFLRSLPSEPYRIESAVKKSLMIEPAATVNPMGDGFELYVLIGCTFFNEESYWRMKYETWFELTHYNIEEFFEEQVWLGILQEATQLIWPKFMAEFNKIPLGHVASYFDTDWESLLPHYMLNAFYEHNPFLLGDIDDLVDTD